MKELLLSMPAGVTVTVSGSRVSVRGPKGELSRPLPSGLSLAVSGSTLKLAGDETRRKDRAVLYTWQSHLKNLFTGVTAGWEAKMKIIYLHFPIKFSVDGKKILIGNFLGEKAPRTARVLDGCSISLDKDTITITGIDKESVGNQCGLIEHASVIRNRDRRVFSDGIWLTQHPQPAQKNN